MGAVGAGSDTVQASSARPPAQGLSPKGPLVHLPPAGQGLGSTLTTPSRPSPPPGPGEHSRGAASLRLSPGCKWGFLWAGRGQGSGQVWAHPLPTVPGGVLTSGTGGPGCARGKWTGLLGSADAADAARAPCAHAACRCTGQGRRANARKPQASWREQRQAPRLPPRPPAPRGGRQVREGQTATAASGPGAEPRVARSRNSLRPHGWDHEGRENHAGPEPPWHPAPRPATRVQIAQQPRHSARRNQACGGLPDTSRLGFRGPGGLFQAFL